ncbi:MAG: mercury transporter MerT [Myxococcales bacterium]|nr:mercury transporter MerT [Myxococcales bacterium]
MPVTPHQTSPDHAREWTIATSVGSILTAFVASLCCVGPLVFALLGIGGAGLLVKFEPVRPYFTVLTLGLLGVGFYLAYRRPATMSTTGEPDCACERPRTNAMGRRVLWTASVLVLGLLAFPYMTPYLFG